MLASLLTPATTKLTTFEDIWQQLAPSLALPETLPAPTTLSATHQRTLEKPLLYSLERLLSPEYIKSSAAELQLYCGGQSYSGFIRRQQARTAPLAVLEPANEQDLVALMRWAGRRDIHLLPWGNGTAPYQGKSCTQEPFMVVKLKHINRILKLDEKQLTLRVQAGATWAEVAAELAERGFSTGTAFPRTHRTIGGTLATNATNTKSLGYGTLAHNLPHIKAITPSGPIMLTYPQSDIQDQRSLVLGAHGRGGFITEVTLRIYPQPAKQGWLLANFTHRELALKALQNIMQSELQLTSIRLTDTTASELFRTNGNHRYLSIPRHLLHTPRAASQLNIFLTGTNKSFDEKKYKLRELLDSTASQVKDKNLIDQPPQGICGAHPQLCQQLWQHDVLAYTLFAPIPWSHLSGFLADWEDALHSVLQSQSPQPGILLTTVHAATDYALVETLLLANQLESNLTTKVKDLMRIQSIAQTTRQRWGEVYVSTLGAQALTAAGQVLDPDNIMLL